MKTRRDMLMMLSKLNAFECYLNSEGQAAREILLWVLGRNEDYNIMSLLPEEIVTQFHDIITQ